MHTNKIAEHKINQNFGKYCQLKQQIVMSRIKTMNGFASWLGKEKLQFIELQKQISPTALFHSSRRKHFVEFCCPHDLTTTRLPPGSFPSNFIQLSSHLILEFDVVICGKVHVSSIPQ